MPSASDLRRSRRDAVKIFTRLAQSLPTPERLSRDASKEVLEDFLERVTPLIDTPHEMDELKRGVALWNGDGPTILFLPETPPLPHPSSQAAEASVATSGPRVHCADIQLTFNGDFLAGQPVSRLDTSNSKLCSFTPDFYVHSFLYCKCQVAQWWPAAGQLLARNFLDWATEIFPQRFAEKLQRTSLTIETSSNGNRVHLHAQFTFERRIDRTYLVLL